ncbi:diguanylate cyclase domain-containing protein [Marinomonas flavescens]|uniref:diguanylate cyclase domain-containing protein n=1 Tax=Marinomonas flavescens TaxID=2529379 RepID=UPI001056A248|nr:diguanylate cyclase [Marinomonas flavescens]
MDSHLVEHDEIHLLRSRLDELEKECDQFKKLNAEHTKRLLSIAEGKSVAFFWEEILKRCQEISAETYGVLLIKDADKDEWSLVSHDQTSAQLLRSEGHIVVLPKSLATFSKSPSCPIRKESNIDQSSEWSLWQVFLTSNGFSRAFMLNVHELKGATYLMVVFQKTTSQQHDGLMELVLNDGAQLIQAAGLRENSDQILLEKGHYDPKTGLLSSFSFENNFSMVLKDSRRHFSRVALISLKLRAKLEPGDDKNLKELARIIQSTIRDNDLVAYYGDGEFVMGIRIRHMKDAEIVTEKLLKAIRFPGSESNRLIAEGICIGMAYYPEHSTLDDLHRATLYASSSVATDFGYRIEFHGVIYATSSEFYTF